MKYSIDERKALKKLGIPDFRHMTKDKIVEFTSMIPQMDPEVAKAAIAQFPEFKGLASEMLQTCKDVVDKLCEANANSQEAFFNECNSIITSLQKELEITDLSAEERDRIENKMIEVAKMVGEKDAQNKKFLLKLGAGIIFAITVIAASAASVLGSNSKIDWKHPVVKKNVAFQNRF